MRLTLLHFNDVHGRLEQLPRLFTLIQRERDEARQAGRRVLLLDGGDSSDRACWESDVTKGRANYALLEAMGVQASVVGNGEALQWGRTALANLVKAVNFPVLAANLVDCADPAQPAVPGLLPYTLIDCGPVRLGLAGVTAQYPGGYDRFGFCSTDPRPALRRALDDLRAQGANVLLLLSHLGVVRDSAEKQDWADPNAYTDDEAARDFPELAAIVGGHTHTALEAPLVFGRVVVAQAGGKGEYLGRLDLDVDDATGAVLAHAGRLIPCGDDVPPDPTIAGTLELVREEADRVLDTQLGTAARDLPHYFDRPSPFGERVAEALREVCGADLAIIYSGFAARGLSAGPITRRQLYQALPGSAHVTAAEVSGAQIQRLVERMLASKYRTESFSPQRNAPPLGLPAASPNARLSFDLARNRLTECVINGRPLDPEARYRLASTYYSLNDLAGNPEYDHIGLEPGQTVEMIQVESVLWEVVEGYVRAHGGL